MNHIVILFYIKCLGRSVQFDSDGDVEMMSDTSQRSNSPPKKKWGRYNPPELKTIEKALEAMVGGMSLTQAANHYNINVTTLKDHADGFASNGFVTRKKEDQKRKYISQILCTNTFAGL